MSFDRKAEQVEEQLSREDTLKIIKELSPENMKELITQLYSEPEYALTLNQIVQEMEREALLAGTHPRLGEASSMKIFGTKPGTHRPNDELADPKVLSEVFKFLG